MNAAIEIGRKFDAALAASIDRQGGPHVAGDTSRRYAEGCINSPAWLRANLDAFRHQLAPEILDVVVSALLLEPILDNAATGTRLVDSMDLDALLSPIQKLCVALRDIAYAGNDVEVTP